MRLDWEKDLMTRLVSQPSKRKLGTSRRSLTGRLVTCTGDAATFESSLERDWLIVLDFDPNVRAIQVQPFTLLYDLGNGSGRYTPDVLVEVGEPGRDADTIVYEVKPADELRENWDKYRTRFKATWRYCRSNGWRFKVVTERHIRTPLLDNARFLRRYRGQPSHRVTCEQLLYTMRILGRTTPQALLAAAYWSADSRLAAIPMLWKMVACRQVAADLSRPLTMTCEIWLPAGE